ncbi:hypothetical protein [Asticcacaulis sp. EMRT-3]|nr:hypothetical protein [Asticcacaulis sp. EMRT-3]MDI7775689.1 hypothetical protein [Asticcacaulis sp. EMRT-3]
MAKQDLKQGLDGSAHMAHPAAFVILFTQKFLLLPPQFGNYCVP